MSKKCNNYDCPICRWGECAGDLEAAKEFGINIPDNELEAAAGWTVSELCDYVEERLKERKNWWADV